MYTTRAMIKLCGGLALAALLVGCNRNAAEPGQPPAAPEAKAPVEVVQAPPPPAAGPPITAYGWGAVTVGVTEAEAVAAGLKSTESGAPGAECHFLVSPDQPGLLAMVEEGKVSRITIREQNKLRTDKGLGVGSTADEVRAAYGADLRSEPQKYEGPPAAYLTHWVLPDKRGIRYVVNAKGVVTEVHGGSASIQYVEGCS